ncbi:FabD/lysophospholipase-like protein [Mycena venus]|uniref:FabD/lysophospholipase-like protein n=1 Tax=Mycena venus TaxID=2733690 RepID=A0A8H6XSC1_9AGAR|nr:FabD/lysophospholipase-like protein [Mycena venus]
MDQCFQLNMSKQKIFLLYGLGGAGKTQIALKFIEEFHSRFTDIFFIDASTLETINASLKTIAMIKGIGQSAQEALQWLKCKEDEWLLLFDNADDPKINLNNCFPQCSHGNILITSRNPGLTVYSPSHSNVSDMEEEDAVHLLLRSAAQQITDSNKGTATHIVKALYYLPLAIIQAGAFISKSGDLNSYLTLYKNHRYRLLSQKPTQSHDNYAWTVYTTWQISFEQLSQQAQKLLQLFSFLHYQGISEEIFKYALGKWKEAEELRALVVEKYRNILGDEHPKTLRAMQNLAKTYWQLGKLYEAEQLGLAVFEKQKSLRGENHPETLRAMANLAATYNRLGRLQESQELELVVLEKRQNILGNNHPRTLFSMSDLAFTYQSMGKFQQAEELEVVVLKKRREILGGNHSDTPLFNEHACIHIH